MAPALKLSEAIRLGSMLGPQADGVFINAEGGMCVQGAALAACGALTRTRADWGDSNHAAMVRLWPWADQTPTTCPVCQRFATVRLLLPHLNNSLGHSWTRERIADWVETLEQHQTIERLAQNLDAQEESCPSVAAVPVR